MRLPNKVNSFTQSILAQFPLFLELLLEKERSVYELYGCVKMAVEDICEFLQVLDCLYALGKVQYDQKRKVLQYVDGD